MEGIGTIVFVAFMIGICWVTTDAVKTRAEREGCLAQYAEFVPTYSKDNGCQFILNNKLINVRVVK